MNIYFILVLVPTKIAKIILHTLKTPSLSALKKFIHSTFFNTNKDGPTISKTSSKEEFQVPPESLTNFIVGPGDNKIVGEEFFKHFVNIGGLKPTDQVLDVGCGFGRMAIPLTGYLTPATKYRGFDIVREAVDWSTKTISSRYSNFKFFHSDIYNKCYNPAGTFKGEVNKFPFEDNSFDFIFLTSVFTHMLPDEIENYMSEISRVLKKNGTCFITFFLLNEVSLHNISQHLTKFQFKYECQIEACRSDHETKPEAVVGYDEEYVQKLFERHSLKIKSPIHFGFWSGRKDFLSFQDIIVAVK